MQSTPSRLVFPAAVNRRHRWLLMLLLRSRLLSVPTYMGGVKRMHVSSAKGLVDAAPVCTLCAGQASTCPAVPAGTVLLHLHPHYIHTLSHNPLHTSSLPMPHGSSPHFSSRPCTAVSAMDTTSSQSEQNDIDTCTGRGGGGRGAIGGAEGIGTSHRGVGHRWQSARHPRSLSRTTLTPAQGEECSAGLGQGEERTVGLDSTG